MGLLSTVAGGIAGMFIKKVTSTADDGTATEQRSIRAFPTATIVVLGCALLYHIFIWPVLNYHFPEYGFPPLGTELLSVLLSIGM